MALVTDEQVIKVLRQYNPWWRNPSAIKEESKPQKRLAYYEALRMIKHKTVRRFAFLYLLGKSEAEGQNGKM